MTVTVENRPQVTAGALLLMERSGRGLLQACDARTSAERYVAAHLAALRAAAAVLAVRGRASRRRGPSNVWEVLARVAPDLGEWAAFFAATASRRVAVEIGHGEIIESRQADDLLRDAVSFHLLVQELLGLPRGTVVPEALPVCR
jgi:hypothetical protein